MDIRAESLISICVCTYKRKDMLARLLGSLLHQKPEENIEIIIVDNDAAESARNLVIGFGKNNPNIKITYQVEETQGISHARNTAVSLSSGEFIAFIDDDEIASKDWLTELIKTQKEEQADVVIGPVIPLFPEGSHRWVMRSEYFSRPRFDSGAIIPSIQARTGNALIRASLAKSRKPYTFSLRFSHSGGEDTDFFNWVEHIGSKLVWSDAARVHEAVPLERQNLRYMMRRKFNQAITFTRKQHENCSKHDFLIVSVKGGAGCILCLIAGIILMPLGPKMLIQCWSKAASGCGKVMAFTQIGVSGYSP